MTALALFLECGTIMATQRAVPGTYATILSAITAASAGDTIAIANGTYSESVAVNKSITLLGASAQVFITPPSGAGISVSANNVRLQSLCVAHGASNGIFAGNVTNLFLTNVESDSNNTSGIQLNSITGASVLTNVTAIGNKNHGLSISAGCANITISGGTFSSNGTGRTDGTGGGINMNASGGGTLISNISVNGPLTASNNTSVGIWLNAASSNDTLKNALIGSTGVITLNNNGGSGVLVAGNVRDASISGNFTKGASNAAGVVVIGLDFFGSSSPVNTVIKKCNFNVGYLSDHPAISLSAPEVFRTGVNSVFADSNIFGGTTTAQEIEDLIYHYPDDPVDGLGLVTHTHDNALPVELTSFTASVRGRQVELRWNTATEVNNYGFEIKRKAINNEQSTMNSWEEVGFVEGNGTTSKHHEYIYREELQRAGRFEYRLKQIDRDGSFEYSKALEVSATLAPGDYGLGQNYPNPFNPSTNIRFALEQSGYAEVKVFDAIGREVQVLFSGFVFSGEPHEISFNPEMLAGGLYFYELTANNRHEIKKMLLLK